MSAIGYTVLRRIAPRAAGESGKQAPTGLVRALGDVRSVIEGRTVIDFGCGEGYQSRELAKLGAKRVIGIDIQDRWLENARRNAAGYPCEFGKTSPALADVIVSIDAFEHFADVPGVLRSMAMMLKPEGVVLASFGPTWLHPYGGHLFSVFPWAHLLFSEQSLIRWRSDFKSDGAKKFGEVEGGLNQITIRRFERFVAGSPLKIQHMNPVPIKGINALSFGPLREFGTSIVRCKLVHR